MLSILLKQIGVGTLGVTNLVLLIWSLLRHRRHQSIPDSLFKLLPVSVVVAAFQVGMGAWFVLGLGLVVTGRHLFYGLLVATGAIAQLLLLPRLPLGQRYRGKPLVYAFWALFVLLTAFRSWMSA